MKDIQRFVKTNITEKSLPSFDDISGKEQERFFDKIKKILDQPENSKWEEMVDKFVEDGYSLKTIACGLFAMNEIKERKYIPIVRATVTSRSDNTMFRRGEHTVRKPDGHDSGRSSMRTLIRFNVGQRQRIAPNFIVGAIVEETGLPAKAIGKIEIYEDYTTVQMTKESAQLVVDSMVGCTIRNYPVVCSIL